jgi:hypothetical protein
MRQIASNFQTLDVIPSPPSCENIERTTTETKQHRDASQDVDDDDDAPEKVIGTSKQK